MADGFEDIEALAVNDALRRAGVDVKLVSVSGDWSVESSHGLCLQADALLCDVLDDCGEGGIMIFPGGMPGSKTLANCSSLIEAMKKHYAQGGLLAAICAAPGLVLSQLDGLEGLEMTCFDGFEQALIDKGVHFVKRAAVRSGQIISGRSAGYAVDFALCVLRALCSEEIYNKVVSGMLLECDSKR